MPDTVDPSIPLAAGQIPYNVQAQQNAFLATQIRQQQLRQLFQSQNALQQLYGNPANLDETGRPTPNAMGRFMAVDPQTGLQMQNAFAQQDQRRVMTEAAQSKVSEAHRKTAYEFGVDVLGTYDDTLKSTGDQRLAGQKAAERRAELLNQADREGSLPKQATQSFPPFDPIKYRSLISSYQAANTKPMTPYQAAELGMQSARLGMEGQRLGIEKQKAEQGKITKDEMGEPIIVNPNTGIAKPIAVSGQSPSAITEKSGLQGEEYLKTLPEATQSTVKALADGRMPFPSGFALRSPYWQKLLQSVSEYDPSFDAVNYQARAKTRADFTSGQAARNITSFNTTIGHLGTLYEKGQKLDNSTFQTYNTVANWLATKTGDPRVVEFDAAKHAVVSEATRAFRGTGGNVHDLVEWEDVLNAANSPKQLAGSIRTMVDLLRSRIDSVGDQYSRGMKPISSSLQLLSPKAIKTLEELPGGEDAKDIKGSEPGQFPGFGKGETSRPSATPSETAKPSRAAAPQQDPNGIYLPQTPDDLSHLKPGDKYRRPNDPPGSYRTN